MKKSGAALALTIGWLIVLVLATGLSSAQTPSPALLVLDKDDSKLAWRG